MQALLTVISDARTQATSAEVEACLTAVRAPTAPLRVRAPVWIVSRWC